MYADRHIASGVLRFTLILKRVTRVFVHVCVCIYIHSVSFNMYIFLECSFQIPPPENVCCVLFQSRQMSLKQIRSIV